MDTGSSEPFFRWNDVLKYTYGRVTADSELSKADEPGKILGKSAVHPTGPKAFFISIVTPEEIFKLFPLFDDEVYKVVDLIASLTGMDPFRDVDYIKSILVKKLEFTRRHILNSLLQMDKPWIEHSAELQMVLQSLASDSQPQRLWDMERLFHSCRLESEVTREAIVTIRVRLLFFFFF